MKSTTGIESFDEIPERFIGVTELDPKIMGHLAFFLASDQINNRVLGGYFWQSDSEEWQDSVYGIIDEARSWKSGETGYDSRFEFAKAVEARHQKMKDIKNIVSEAVSLDADAGIAHIYDYIERSGFTVRYRYKPSPLFPDGREDKMPISSLVLEDGQIIVPRKALILNEENEELPHAIKAYIDDVNPSQKSSELVSQALSTVEVIDEIYYEKLREKYGAKAAALLCFKEKVDAINELFGDTPNTLKIDVPPFLTVGVDVYDHWKNKGNEFDEECERLRKHAVGLLSDDEFGGGTRKLVIIRSSAVKSEDGEQFTGAGVYLSVAVDPNDQVAFRDAIEKVYESCTSKSAQSYQKRVGVEDESMGLVIQVYLEQPDDWSTGGYYHGHANSQGINKNLIEVNTQKGDLLYDKPVVKSKLLRAEGFDDRNQVLHTYPDHRNEALRYATYSLCDVPHAAVLAEQLFKKPMQLEFVNNSIVQVRPLIGLDTQKTINFPDIPERFTLAATGVGDVVLKRLADYGDNNSEHGYIIIHDEHAFTVHGSYDVFPKTGAVVLMQPSSSGHVQAHCRENGIMCFYFKAQNDRTEFWQSIGEANEDKTLRFVSDGYTGKIY